MLEQPMVARNRLRFRRFAAVAGSTLAVATTLEWAAAQQRDSSSAVATGAISGVVIDATTHQPVAGATVRLSRTSGSTDAPAGMVTDARGRFVFSRLPAAPNYYLGASRFGYASTRYGWTAPGGSLAIKDILQISVADNQWVNNITIPLWRYGSVTGRVIDERGEPLVGIAVSALAEYSFSGQPQLVAAGVTTTDDRGVYRINDLKPGRYFVEVLSVQSTVLNTTAETPQTRPVGQLESDGIGGGRGASTVNSPGLDIDGRHRLILTNFATPPPPASGRTRAYPARFYPSARSSSEAVGVEIEYGDNRTGIDIQLAPVAAVRVSGHLEGARGLPPGFLLRLMPRGSERLGFGSEAATTVIDADGSFTFLNVPQGDYTLLALASVMDFTMGDNNVARLPDAPGFGGRGIQVGSMPGLPDLEYLMRSGPAVPVWGRVSISVGTADLADVVVPMHPAAQVKGHLAFAEGTIPLAPGTRVLVVAEPANGDPTLGSLSTLTPTDPAFSFTLENVLGGTYLLSTWANMGIVSVMSGGRDVVDTGIDASSGQNVEDVVITLTDKKITVTGSVNGSGGPAVAAVIAFPLDRERWINYGWQGRRFQTARTNSQGAFQLDRLPEGEYSIIAVDLSQIDAWTNPQFLALAAPRATPLSVKWGETKTVNLTLTDIRLK